MSFSRSPMRFSSTTRAPIVPPPGHSSTYQFFSCGCLRAVHVRFHARENFRHDFLVDDIRRHARREVEVRVDRGALHRRQIIQARLERERERERQHEQRDDPAELFRTRVGERHDLVGEPRPAVAESGLEFLRLEPARGGRQNGDRDDDRDRNRNRNRQREIGEDLAFDVAAGTPRAGTRRRS